LENNKARNVLFMPGIVTPAVMSFAALLDQVKDDVQPVLKDLEVYATEKPPVGYSLELEVEGLRRAADNAGFKNFHLIGFSGGGAISLAFTARFPERLQSLALIEPAWIGNENSAEDVSDWAELDQVLQLPFNEQMGGFMHWHMRSGVEPPKQQLPPGPPPPWMTLRPAGIDAISAAFKSYQLDHKQLRHFKKPVYYALGSLTRAIFERRANTLAGLFPDFQLEVFEGRSHFDPPHRTEPERIAKALRKLWDSSESHKGSRRI
jgi:pimeloyl-ACP methyl ester carboxylesterase